MSGVYGSLCVKCLLAPCLRVLQRLGSIAADLVDVSAVNLGGGSQRAGLILVSSVQVLFSVSNAARTTDELFVSNSKAIRQLQLTTDSAQWWVQKYAILQQKKPHRQ